MNEVKFYTPENIISTLGIELSLPLVWDSCTDGNEETCILIVEEKNVFTPFQFLSSDFNLKGRDNQKIKVALKLHRMKNDADYMPYVEINHPNISRLVTICNKHLEIFTHVNKIKGIYQEVYKEDIVYLTVECDYQVIGDELVLIDIIYAKTVFIRTYKDPLKNRKFDVQNIIDNVICLLDINCIDEYTNVEEMTQLMIKQLLVEEMKTI